MRKQGTIIFIICIIILISFLFLYTIINIFDNKNKFRIIHNKLNNSKEKNDKFLDIQFIKNKKKVSYLEYNTLKDIPIYIIAYNNLYYVKNMIKQLEKYTKNINIIDNNSTYLKLLNYYEDEYNYNLIKMPENYGYLVYLNQLYEILPEKFIITDPDLELNPNLPYNFIDELDIISEKYKIWKVGFAIDIFDNSKIFYEKDYFNNKSIYEHESQFWENKIEENIYVAPIDTTFCLCNKKYYKNDSFTPSLRIAGNYTTKHLPWYIENWKKIPKDEIEFYIKNNNSSTILNIIKKFL